MFTLRDSNRRVEGLGSFAPLSLHGGNKKKPKKENEWLRGTKEHLERNSNKGHRAWQRVKVGGSPVGGKLESEGYMSPAEKDGVEKILSKRQKEQIKKRRQKEKKVLERTTS